MHYVSMHTLSMNSPIAHITEGTCTPHSPQASIVDGWPRLKPVCGPLCTHRTCAAEPAVRAGGPPTHSAACRTAPYTVCYTRETIETTEITRTPTHTVYDYSTGRSKTAPDKNTPHESPNTQARPLTHAGRPEVNGGSFTDVEF